MQGGKLDAPNTCMMQGLMSIRMLPKPARLAWRELFDHYVFRVHDDTVDHLDVKIAVCLERSRRKTITMLNNSSSDCFEEISQKNNELQFCNSALY